MSKLLFIIPNLNENVTGASKRAINIARELSRFHFVRIISSNQIREYKNYKLIKQKNSLLIINIFHVFFSSYTAWFSDHIRWSLIPKKNLIFTLHDMKEFTKFNRQGFIKKILLRIIILKTKYLITVSENQKKSINKLLSRSSKVVLNSVTKEWINKSKYNFDVIKKKYRLHKKYVIYVSNFTYHKNHLSLINQENIRQKYSILLVGTPQDKVGFKIYNDLKKEPGMHILQNIDENELISIVDNCEFGIFPSNYEGFGMPILETITRGKNILVSNKLELDHFENCQRVKLVSFDKIISNDDILWAEEKYDCNEDCISTKDWSDSVNTLKKFINVINN